MKRFADQYFPISSECIHDTFFSPAFFFSKRFYKSENIHRFNLALLPSKKTNSDLFTVGLFLIMHTINLII